MITSASYDYATGIVPPYSPRTGRTRDRWIVLVVDDEAGVHEITRLVLADTSFAGIPIELHSAYSASEAQAFVERHPDTALMLLDVVMETDHAGLRLVNHLRERMGNLDLQIVLRTGQPGMAPERDVITRYDVNGYVLKTELVAQKLRSIVISSLRAYSHIRTLRPHGGSRAAPQAVRPTYQRLALEEDFGKAIAGNTIRLSAQPQIHLGSGTIAAVELVTSWPRTDAIVTQAQVADEVCDPELRQKFDSWLVRQGCRWIKTWRSLAVRPFRVTLPILAEDFRDFLALSELEEQLACVEAPPGALDLEIPEGVLLAEQTGLREAVAAVRALGVSLTLVGFGLGHVSLSRLQRLRPNRVKIHSAFVRHVTRDRERSAVARSIIALAHTLELEVIADGIGTEQELQFFKWEGCDIGQGDLLAKPMIVTEVDAALSSWANPAPFSCP